MADIIDKHHSHRPCALLSKSARGLGLQTYLLRLTSCCAAPALDLDFLLGIMHEKRPLDWEAVLSSNVPLKVVASCLDTLQPVILENFTDAKDLETCLRASANVPEVRSFLLIADNGLGGVRATGQDAACMHVQKQAQQNQVCLHQGDDVRLYGSPWLP